MEEKDVHEVHDRVDFSAHSLHGRFLIHIKSDRDFLSPLFRVNSHLEPHHTIFDPKSGTQPEGRRVSPTGMGRSAVLVESAMVGSGSCSLSVACQPRKILFILSLGRGVTTISALHRRRRSQSIPIVSPKILWYFHCVVKETRGQCGEYLGT